MEKLLFLGVPILKHIRVQLFDLFRRTRLSRSILGLSPASMFRRNKLVDIFVKTYWPKPHIVMGTFHNERY